MNVKNNRQKKKKKPHCGEPDIVRLGFVMLVVGVTTVCAFVLPVKAWILMLGVALIYCGWKLFKSTGKK